MGPYYSLQRSVYRRFLPFFLTFLTFLIFTATLLHLWFRGWFWYGWPGTAWTHILSPQSHIRQWVTYLLSISLKF